MFPCPAGCVLSFGRKSSSSNRSSRRVLCLIVQTIVQKLVENYCFSRVSDDTLGTFWARFWRRSVLQGHCVSLCGRVRFQPREEEQQQQQEQQEGSMSHCTTSGIKKTGRKQPSTSIHTMQHQHSTAAGRRYLTQFFYGFRRHVRHFLGSIFVPSFRATVFPCPAGCVLSFGRKSSSSNRSSRRVLCLIVQTIVQKLVENYCFSRVSDDTLGTFWARFWRRSVLQGHCVSLSGRVRFQPREEEQQQQQEQQEGSMSHCTTSGIKKLVENYCFSRVSAGTLGSFWARFWRCSVLQGHCVSLSGRVRFQLREEEQQQQQEQQEGSMSPPGNLLLRLIWRSFRPSVAWCFGVAKGAFWRLAAPPLVAAPAAAAAGAVG